MNELSVDELNNEIMGIDFWKSKHNNPMPSIESVKVIVPSNICSLDERREVRNRIIGKQIPLGYDISSDSYLTQCVCKFILDKKIPPEEKKIVCEYLDEKLKKIIFEQFVKSELKTKFKAYIDDISSNIYYSPRVNGVPLKIRYRDSNNVLHLTKIDVMFEDIEDFLINKPNSHSNSLLLCVKHLLNESNILNEKWCPEYIKKMINDLNNNAWVEYEQKICNDSDRLIKEDLEEAQSIKHRVRVNENLKRVILDSIPSDFNLAEKAIYIYAKLCQILSYAPLYYLEKKSQYDKSIAKVEDIDINNNSVTCYEFSYMYADLLTEIGITKIKEHKLDGDKFHDEHANVLFLADDLVIFADSTRTIIQGDLTSLKYSSGMTGIRCELYDENSQKKFIHSRNKVIDYINKENMKITSMLPDKDKVDDLSIQERIILFNNLLVNCNLINTDFISYAGRLISTLKLNIDTKLFYNDDDNNFFLQIDLTNYYGENLLSYIIDSSTKKIYNEPNESLKFKENVTNRHK